MPMRAEFRGDRLRAARARAGLSAAEVASAAGVSASTLRRWEGGRASPRRGGVLLSIRDALNAVLRGEERFDLDEVWRSRWTDVGTAPIYRRWSGRALRKARAAAGTSRVALAATVGAELGSDVRPRMVERWEAGRATPDIDQALVLAHVLGVTLADLGR